jgi:transposase-like protein
MAGFLSFKLSSRHLAKMMAERNLSMAHTTIMRWVHHCAPECQRRWNRLARPAGSSWRVGETYVKARGKWVFVPSGGPRGKDRGLSPE